MTNTIRATDKIEPRLLTIEDLSVILKLSKRTLWRMRSACQLPKPIRLGNSVRWRVSDIEAWLNQRCPSQQSATYST